MGTNYYFCVENGERFQHIGKRSAAGLFCWDCGITLHPKGNHKIHSEETKWLKVCPVCGKEPEEESLFDNSAGRELGFNRSEPAPKYGVKSCSSFSWAINLSHFYDLGNVPTLHIENEYGRKIHEFSKILSECPIKFYDSIGQEFN